MFMFETRKRKIYPESFFPPFPFFFSLYLLGYNNMNEISKESAFLITNASGRHINLLNDCGPIATSVPSPPSSDNSDENTSTVDAVSTPTSSSTPVESASSKRKYHCTEPGCAKSFTTRFVLPLNVW